MKLFTKMAVFVGMFLFFGTVIVKAECVGVITAGGGRGFWNIVKKGAVQAGKELGISVYVRGAVDESNAEGQRLSINYMMRKGCRGLVLAPNSKERKKDVALLKTQGIPTVYIDRDMGGDRISVIKTDNPSAGELAGREMVKALKGKGRVAVLRLNKDVLSTTSRENGFIREAVKGGLEIIVDQYIGTMVGAARGETKRIFSKASNIDGVFTPNESTTIGAMSSLIKLKKAGKVVHIGFDANELIIEALPSNYIYGFVVQRPFEMGYQGVHTVYQAMQGNGVKNKIDTGVTFVNRDNINNPKIKEMLGLN
ncbi:substrate-binding domain-containing protein [Desulfobacterales bacterium HSG2]|nr:substrate-binding domain-containing protein [Desulfobacterales bacterium HSG2]